MPTHTLWPSRPLIPAGSPCAHALMRTCWPIMSQDSTPSRELWLTLAPAVGSKADQSLSSPPEPCNQSAGLVFEWAKLEKLPSAGVEEIQTIIFGVGKKKLLYLGLANHILLLE